MRSEEEINIKINSLYQELKDKLSNELYSKEEKKIFSVLSGYNKPFTMGNK